MTALREHAEQIRIRILADSFREAKAATWEARAELLEWARPRPGDFTGRPWQPPPAGWCPVCGNYVLSSAEARAARCCVGLPIIDGRREGPDCRGKAPRQRPPERPPEDIADRDRRLAELAETCRQHAKLLREVA